MKAFFIAEVSSNHNQKLDRCLAFIDKAAEVGCAAVKFQLFRVEKLFAPEILEKSETHRLRKTWELPPEFLPELSDHCRKAGIQFACTPFYLEAVEELFPYVNFYKIASYELLRNDLLAACAETGKPVVLSTGMATLDEVRAAVEVLRRSGCKELSVLHCISGYPAPFQECNLAAIETLRDVCECPVGWSDHSLNPGVIFRAVFRWGAEMVEFHMDLEGNGMEFSGGHCWRPEQIGPVIKSIQDGLLADGNGQKKPGQSEISDRDWRADPADGLRPLISRRKDWKCQ